MTAWLLVYLPVGVVGFFAGYGLAAFLESKNSPERETA
jgi:hypothetical protein